MATIADEALFRDLPEKQDNLYRASLAGASDNEVHTNDAFSEKWVAIDQGLDDEDEEWKRFQLDWYCRSYGFANEGEVAAFLADKKVILDAGCGVGFKGAWMARLAPHATVIAMDLSESVRLAAQRYADYPNMLFVQGDIAKTPFRDGTIDLVSCDQVLHHTDSPPATVREFARILSANGVLNTYVYSKKALPRELLDEHFREKSKEMSRAEIWDLSRQLTDLGKILTDLDVTIDVPDMPALGIKGGPQDLQRFIYWNFIKCFWNEDMGDEASLMTNFDWYAPSTAFRYSADEFHAMLADAGFRPDFVHSEEACHTGRFVK